MRSLRAVIVEDEPTGIENLRYKLEQQCPEVEIVAECLSGKDAIRQIQRHLPDLVFLDIMLGDMTGFDVLKEIRQPTFAVVFTTSYDEYAIQAIQSGEPFNTFWKNSAWGAFKFSLQTGTLGEEVGAW